MQRSVLQHSNVPSTRINISLKNHRLNGGIDAGDKRSKYDRSSMRISQFAIQTIEDHIRSFPVNESHYIRSHSNIRQYLMSMLTLQKMCDLYIQKCQEDILPQELTLSPYF